MSNYDEIRLIGIGGYGYHGVLATEREEGQPFHADLVLHLDTAQAAASDELGHTADYSAVARAVVEVIEGEPANLIETLAARIADVALSFGVAKVDVTLHKPQAPLGVPFTDVQVHVSRTAPTGASTDPAGPGVDSLAAAATTEEPEPAQAELEQAPADVEPVSGADAEPAVMPVPPVLPPAPPIPAPTPMAAPIPPPAAVPVPDLLADNEGVPAKDAQAAAADLETAPESPVKIVLGLGGNLGDVRETLRESITDLDKTPGIQVTDVSALARTAAVTHGDAVAQSDYLNAVVIAETTLSPRELLDAVHRIEDAHGRVRVERWGDRTLDIDIITFADVLSNEPELTLPHPRAANRAFVLVPWAQVEPDAAIPGEDGGQVAELAEAAPDRPGVRWLALDWLEERDEPAAAAPRVPAPKQQPADPEPAPEQPAAEQPAPEQLAVPEESAAAEDAPAPAAAPPAPAAPLPGAPVSPPPVSPAEKSEGEPPAVAEWLASEPAGEPEYENDVQPALPVTPPIPTSSADRPAQGAEEQEPQQVEEPGAAETTDEKSDDAGAIDWLGEEASPPPLSGTPPWTKVRREE